MSGVRVLHIVDKIGIAGSPIHGPSRLLLALWPELESKGVELGLSVLRDRTEAASEFEDAGVDIAFLGRGRTDPRTLFDLIKVIRKGRWNIVHLHGYGATTFGRLAALYCRVPAIVHEHMVDDNMPSYQKIADRVLSSYCDFGIAVSRSVKTFMIEGRCLQSEIVDVIPNTVAIRYADRPSNDFLVNFKKELGLPAKCRLVGAVGRLHPIKGFNYLIDAFAKIMLQEADVYLILVGDGDERESLESQVDAMGLTSRVLFVGHQDDVRPYLAAMDVLVLSSLSEGCPLSLLEGLAFGIPVVATRVGGIPEVLTDNVSGLLAEPCDADSLANCIIRCLTDTELAYRLSAGARQSFQNDFAPDAIADRYLEAYEQVLGRPALGDVRESTR